MQLLSLVLNRSVCYLIGKDLVKFYVRAMDSTHLDGQLASLPGRYARTLFELGIAANNGARIQENIDHFNQVFETADHFKTLLLSPTTRVEEQQAVLTEIAKTNHYDPLFLRFLCLLCENRRLKLFSPICQIFKTLVRESENIKDVEVISAIELNKKSQQQLQQILGKKISSQLNFSYQIDPQILGGFLVRIGCHVIDLTVSNQINMLATEMKGNA